MIEFIVTFLVGAVCVGLGISNRKGNINSLHSYHRSRVSEEDRLPFGRQVGLGTIIAGVSIMAQSVLSAVAWITENDLFLTIGMVLMGVGLVVGIVICFGAMRKYNKGIF